MKNKKFNCRADVVEFLKQTSYLENMKRLYSCTAWYGHLHGTESHLIVLRSYQTKVAVYDTMTGNLYYTDFWSSTTTQHICKFAKLMAEVYGSCHKVCLYNKSGTPKKIRLQNLETDFAGLF